MNQLVIDIACVTSEKGSTSQIKLDTWDFKEIRMFLLETVIGYSRGIRIDFDKGDYDVPGSITICPTDTPAMNITFSLIRTSSQLFFPSTQSNSDLANCVHDFLKAAADQNKIQANPFILSAKVKEIVTLKQVVGVEGSVVTDVISDANNATCLDIIQTFKVVDKPFAVARTLKDIICIEIPGETIPGDGITPSTTKQVTTYHLSF